MSLKNLGNLSALLDVFDELGQSQKTFNLKEFIDSAKNFTDGMKIDDAIKGLRQLGVSGDDLADVLIKMGFEAKEVKSAIEILGTTGSKSTRSLGTAFSGLAAKIGISTTALGTLLGVAAGLAVVAVGVQMYNDHIQDLVDNAREAASAWSESNSSINSYVDRINELRTALDSGTLSEEEAYQVKSELLSIQQSLMQMLLKIITRH